MKRWVFRLFVILSLLSSAAAMASGSGVEERFNRLYAIAQETFGQPDLARIAQIEKSYAAEFGAMAPSGLPGVSDADLALVFRAAETVEFYSRDSAYLAPMRAVLAELERRGIATDAQRTSYFQALVGLRQFDVARSYASANPSLRVEAIPRIDPIRGEKGLPMVYEVDRTGSSLRPRYVDIRTGTKLIVVAHPLCAFSRRAMETLAADTELRPLLPDVLWMAPVDQLLFLDVVSNWNQSHPLTRIVLARRLSDWPMFQNWATPHFYLLRDGKLVDDFAGWPKSGNRNRLVQLLKKGRLLNHGSVPTDR